MWRNLAKIGPTYKKSQTISVRAHFPANKRENARVCVWLCASLQCTLTVRKKKEEKNLQNYKNEKEKHVLIILSDSQIDNRVYPFTIKNFSTQNIM